MEECVEEGDMPGSMPDAGHAHAPHGHGSGIPWLDVIVTVSVVFLSLLSLVVSIEHGRTMEKMVEQNQKLVVASTLPLLNVGGSQLDPVTNKPLSRLVLANNGVGPAIIEWFQIRYKGVAQTPETFLGACCAQALGKGGDRSGFIYSNISGAILPARETRDLITIKPIGSGYKLLQAYEDARKDLSISACYCSVLEECWEADFEHKRPQPVKECKVAPGEKLW
jgi:hypothetical protein